MLLTHADKSEHYLQLDDGEKALFTHIKEQKAKGIFKKIIVLLNCTNAMELGVLQDDDDIDAILWFGTPGTSGLRAVGPILTNLEFYCVFLPQHHNILWLIS